ncbi:MULTISPECIES: PepSY domain-containing protein [unclassified Shinella]|jgi:uncharacterized membrane protein YkoI|uniref:PepSY domain-containing protein n=1 Tax=unclassified Shinella TaxID=2643062 RepID=UPI0003C5494D|nr:MULTISPECIES: PepSY domain-containing protein [unclassified Shinella]MCA0339013.1 PepSY domain-containing protein [Pseudomonadota bacterium]EYR82596.1 putative membrane protein [Shinella sp. DD12]MCO5148791.1 PepSY domain-containing protein [Shinella sp.]MDC7264853.1 PepSY domain-containing protein [Shinella sp. HY16]MDC7271750.1 PepSY domain-containing protein [Shinella sp. YZ44]
MRILLMPIAALSLAGLLSAGAVAHADDDGHDTDGRTLDAIQEAVEKGAIKPFSELREIASRRVKGDIVRVEPRRKHGRFLYKFKVLSPEGQLVEIEMDAASGTILEIENE